MKAKLLLSIVIFHLAFAGTFASTAVTGGGEDGYFDFDFDWRFSRTDSPAAYSRSFDDSSWRVLNVPHDWSIEEPFSADYASGTGYAAGGVGWYRKSFVLYKSIIGKSVSIEFDGVYCNAQVWINGHFVGGRPYGYSSFQFDLTPHLLFDGMENIIAVRVDHTKVADSRWYTGSGIYRHVRLRITDKLHIAHWGTVITTPKITDRSATINVKTKIENTYNDDKTCTVKLEIISPDGRAVASKTSEYNIASGDFKTVSSTLMIGNPQRWSVETPALYRLKSTVMTGRKRSDYIVTNFGIRTFRFDADKGFFLNSKSLKLKGFCVHHDAGCLGAAVADKVLHRRLVLLKELGCNAIRTSHNPPSPELLDMCDRMGFLVQDEAFDEFTPPKNKWVKGRNVGIPARYGYGEIFEDWAVRDVQDMVRRDINHPSIIMWSIGNEIDYANDPFSHRALGSNYKQDHPAAENLVKHGTMLVKAVKAIDTTRPVTAGLANITMSNAVGLPETLDIVGYNYQEQFYDADHKTYPNRVIYGSENGDAYNAWLAVRDNEYISGQFLWTAFDYLGEASEWPHRIFNGGVVDIATFRKPVGWWRQALWSDKPMVYLCVKEKSNRRWYPAFEHWNFDDGATVQVYCATNCPEVALTLNGKKLDTFKSSDAKSGWLIVNVPYKSGTLKAIGTDGKNKLCEYSLTTSKAAAAVKMIADVRQLKGDGKDICHIEFNIVDKNGVRVHDASNEVELTVTGPARLIGMDNGSRSGPVDYKDSKHDALNGRGIAIIQSTRDKGTVTIRAESKSLKAATVILNVK